MAINNSLMKRIILSSLILFYFGFGQAQILDPVTWSWEIEEDKLAVGDEVDLVFTIAMDANWYVYANDFDPNCGPNLTIFSFEEHDSYSLIGESIATNAEKKYDKVFGCDVKVFHETGFFKQKIKILKKDLFIAGTYEFQTCNQITGLCLPPKEGDFNFTGYSIVGTDISTKALEKDTNPIQINNRQQTKDTLKTENVFGNTQILDQMPQDSKGEDKPPISEIEVFKTDEDKTLWAFIVIAFLSGLAALLTPCVFPMIPMTVTFFLKDKEIDKSKGVKNGLIFGISIIIIYTILGTLFSLIFGADSLNAMATHWLPNIFAFLVFFVFALSFLGMFEITIPSAIINMFDTKADQGGMIGIFFMAFTLALVSFSCTFPIVGLVLALSAQGAFLKPVLGMMSFSLALALPFTLFALFPHWLQKLPKSGGWLNSVKVVLGFLELALGLKFLSVADLAYHWGILDREVYIAAWIVIFSMIGFYLLGKIQLPNDSRLEKIGVPRAVLSIFVFTFVVYLVPGLFGAPLKGLSGYLPPMHTMDNFSSSITEGGKLQNYDDKCEPPKFSNILHFPHGLTGYFDLEQAKECAQVTKKPILIDFTGHGCVNCRKMEEYVWSDPRILEILNEDYIITALYVDDKTELPEEEWFTSENDGKIKKSIGKQNADFQISRFQNNAQPFYIILAPDGSFLHGPGQYDLSVDTFVKFLEEGKQKYNTFTSGL